MLLANFRQRRLFLQFADALLACLAFISAFALRNLLYHNFNIQLLEPNIGSFLDYLPFLFPLALFTPFVLSYYNFYALGLSQSRAQILNLCFQCAIVLFLIQVLLMFFFKESLSRATFILFIPLCALFFFTRQFALRLLRSRISRSHRHLRNLLLVTDLNEPTTWAEDIRQHPELGFQLSKQLNPSQIDLSTFVETLHSEAIQLVIFDIRKSSLEKVAEELQACEEEGIEVWLSTGLFQTRIAQAKVDYFADRPILIFRSTPTPPSNSSEKPHRPPRGPSP
ncbi:MAG: hypothetical protein HC904_15555, partial [Blastochloris sp.]|nr:hypothetical protein [Blastochloris sp.]